MATKTAPTVEELRTRMLAGDTKVTPADITNARAAEEFAQLQAEVDQARAREEAEAQRAADIAALQADVAEFTNTHAAAVQAAYERCIVAQRELKALMGTFAVQRLPLARRRRELGVGKATAPLPKLASAERIWNFVRRPDDKAMRFKVHHEA